MLRSRAKAATLGFPMHIEFDRAGFHLFFSAPLYTPPLVNVYNYSEVWYILAILYRTPKKGRKRLPRLLLDRMSHNILNPGRYDGKNVYLEDILYI